MPLINQEIILLLTINRFPLVASLVVGLLLGLCSCHKQATLQSYYFPSKHQVYVYSANDSIGKEYWEITPKQNGLSTIVYDGSLRKTQQSHESFYSNGVNLERLLLGGTDKQTEAVIESGFVFPFDEIDSSEVVFYRIKWESDLGNGQPTTYELVRNRRFVGFEEFMVVNKKMTCAKFELNELIISDLDGSIEITTSGVEFYAKDIGLVYRKRQMTEELLIEQQLLAIMTPDEFDRLKN